MGYVNKSKVGRWGLPAGLIALILGLVLFGGATGPATSLAATIGCGGCHSNPPQDSDSVCPKPTSKNHPTHSSGSDMTTCDRCHPTVSSPGHPNLLHNNNVANITSLVAPGMRLTAGTCTKACHKNSDAAWGGTLNCNDCHFRAGALGNYQPSGLHVDANRLWKHYSSPVKVTDNTKTITCLNCHPTTDSDTATPRAHITPSSSTNFAERANMSMAFQNATVTGIGYVKGAAQGTGTCLKSCHYNAGDPFGNRTIYFKPGQKMYFGPYQTANWSDQDLKCNECHSTPGQEASYGGSSSINANKRHEAHMFKYKMNPWNFQNEDRNIYCDDCHRTPDIYTVRGFLHHSTIGKDGSGVISLPVKSQYSRVYMLWRNNGIGRDKANPPVYNKPNTSCSNVYCHTIMTSGSWTEEACSSCHGSKDGVNTGSGAPGYMNWTTSAAYVSFEEYSGGGGAHYTHVTKRGYPCRSCHYDGGGDGDPSQHHNIVERDVQRQYVDVGVQPQYWFNNVTSKYDKTTRACTNVKCHYGASQNWDCDPLH